MSKAELKKHLQAFFKEIIFLYGTEAEKKSFLIPRNWDSLTNLWMDILIDEKITPESFLKRWKALKKVYGTSKEHYGIPKPAYFLTIQPAKEERELEPEPKPFNPTPADIDARERFFAKMKDYSKQTEVKE